MNTLLLLESGRITGSGLQRTPDGSLVASWALSWPEQSSAGISPVVLMAYYGIGFHHPHLRGATGGDWPLNVFTRSDAAELPRALSDLEIRQIIRQFAPHLPACPPPRWLPPITPHSPSRCR